MKKLFLIILTFFFQNVYSQTINLHSNWQFKQEGLTTWYKATIPGTVHTDLLNNKLIPDPFYRDNETSLQWIGEKNWTYKTQFNAKQNFASSEKIQIKFHGLDTYAEVYLNGTLILKSDNMFRTYQVDIKNLLQERNNELKIIFKSALAMTDSLAKHSNLIRPCENNRHYARKAQYHFGWDWAPKLTTCGIWRSVQLIYDPENKLNEPQYSPIRLVQENDSIGSSFYFKVNDKPVFMKGANWIPADVFLPRISKDKYRSLLIAAKEANFNMLRVWGGGIYEDDYFYDLCDSLNIYIWQDFMFAGAMYPAETDFIENIKQEAIDNILRLRKHKCIALWCGNNEIDEAWHNWGWQKQFKISSSDSIKLWNEYQLIFHELLPSLVKQYDSGRQYIASSPLYGWGRQKSMTHGDSHYWGMWWGMDSISIMKKKIPRFMSEYGMQAMPNLKTVQQFALLSDMDTSSVVMKLHQKHPTGYSTLSKYLNMEGIKVYDFNSFIHGTQELQSRALETTIRAQLNSNGRCMGSLLWQFNDCWPVCSWSIIDYYGRKKKGFETVKRLYR